jgi:hypothetical protein
LHEDRERLLVHTSFEESHSYSSSYIPGRDSTERERLVDAMDSKFTEEKASAVETHTTTIGSGANYRKANDDFGPSVSGPAYGVTDGHEMDMAEPVPSRIELATALQEIEGKKTKWYAYLTTKDFYIVLALGYVLFRWL